MTEQQKEFVKEVFYAAKRYSEISPYFVTAQAVLESGYGKKRIGKYNIFGITRGSNWTGKTVLVKTKEVYSDYMHKFSPGETVWSITRRNDGRYEYVVSRYFKDFNSLEECLSEHYRILTKEGYKDAWPYRRDPYEFTKRICDNVGYKYATSPDYIKLMTSVIDSIKKVIG